MRLELWPLTVAAPLAAFVATGCSSDGNSGSNPGTGGAALSAGAASTGAAANAGGSTSGTAGTSSQAGATVAGSSSGGAGGGTGGSPANGGTNPNGGGGSVTGGSGGSGLLGRTADETCTRWKTDTADLDEGTWSGSVATCDAGDISANGRDNALRLFNLVRWLADLPAVVTEDSRNQQAQACALMMTANDMLSHTPPMDWKCYSDLGAKGASTSNISGGPGVASVFSYMVDSGNEATFGHRRIVLSNELGPIGLGSAGKDGSSCMQNIGGTGKAGKAWMAWPPPGPFPMQAYTDVYERSLDSTGWSIQSKSIDLSQAQVTVTSGGQSKAVKVEQLMGTYGQAKAIRIVLDGWKATAGQTYAVSVSGVATPISYEFQLIDCK
ncbi:MAG TPA: CAP domain-containing protein [Polyangiaceae bacterium]|nr:CAP domain-containing protein [Polyangiaceae bacterium]